MPSITVLSTSDVPLDALRDLSLDVSPELEVEVNESQIYLKSADPPSWVTLLAGADWWKQALAVYAGLYIAEIVKEVAKYTWDSRTKVVAAAVTPFTALRKLATGIAGLRHKVSSRTRVRIALPVPDEYFSTGLGLLGSDPVDLELQIALFVHHLPRVDALIRNEALENKVVGGIKLRLLPDASLEVSWLDKDSSKVQARILPLELPD